MGYADVTAIRGYDAKARPNIPVGGVTARVTAGVGERLQLQLPRSPGAKYEGYFMANGRLETLPAGSSLSASTGLFAWQPPVPYIGEYDLVFVRDVNGKAERIPVRVQLGKAAPVTRASARR